jgi:hypothetical protein
LFQFVWGGGALVWIVVFAMSRHQILAPLSFTVIVILGSVIARSAKHLPFTPDQSAVLVFLTGLAAWIAFARWYMRAPTVTRPGWIAGWGSGQPPPELARLGEWRVFGRTASANSNTSRATALCQHLMGSDSILPNLFVGLLITVLFLTFHFVFHADAGRPLLISGVSLLPIISCTFTPHIVRRSRLLWLRAGLDRAGLFATAEGLAWRAVIAMVSSPAILFAFLTLTQWPGQILSTMLFIALELAIAGCFLYAGLAVTRGWNAAVIGVLVAMVAPAAVVSSSFAPLQVVSAGAFAVALPAFGILAVVMRGFARRAWLVLDWRVAGKPLLTGLRGN